MKASKKRGFTIIELVIVIAVIAILAAVLIPTFSNVIQKAKEANDTVMVKSMNTALVNDSNLNGGTKHATMSDALTAAKNAGYDVEKIRSTANNNKILWDSVSDCFVYMKGTEITYIPDSKDAAADTTKKYNYFDIVDTAAEVASSDYSTYLAGTSATGDITAKAGFDAGENTAIASVTYTNAASAQNVIIRTNGGKLTVDASADTVNHYGDVENLNVIAVDIAHSYHEFGKAGFVALAKGHFVCESNAQVITLVVSGSNSEIKVDKTSNATIENAYTTNEASKENAHGGNTSLTYKTFTDEELADVIYDSEAKVVNAISVNGKYYKNMEAAFARVNSGASLGYEVGGVANIVLYKDITDIGNVFKSNANIVLDLNKHTYTIKGAVGSQNTETNAFQILKDSKVVIKNGTIAIDSSNLVERKDGHSNIKRLIQNYADLTLEDVVLDTRNLYGNYNNPISFNNGSSVIKGNTSIILKEGVKTAFDSDGNWGPYDRAKVTIDTTGSIGGYIELGNGYLDIKNVGSCSGIVFCNLCGAEETKAQHLRLTKSASLDIAAPNGYSWNSDGTGLIANN